MKKRLFNGFAATAMIWMLAAAPLAVLGQTRISMPKNRYNVQDDVKVGREASVEVRKQFPLVSDQSVDNYVERVGERLVAAIPSQFRQPAFDYTFDVVNARDINAFALPGGPMFVNRGMIEAARNEGEMAGVMAHEISHVALRHATAQATKQGSWQNQLGVIGMVLGGAILGGQTGAQLGMLGAQAWLTKYSRDYERQADILGAQIMADAGYDPRDLANMFQTIAGEGGARGPEWLSSHPDPGNRYQNINREASMLRVSSNPIKSTPEFRRVQERLRSMPQARTMAEIEQGYKSGSGPVSNPTAGGRYSNSVQLPSTRTRTYSSGNWIRMNVPNNWREFSSESSVQFAPEGAYGDQGITHGVMIGVARSGNGNLQQVTQDYINGILQSNSYLRQRSGFSRTTLAGRTGYMTVLSGQSPITGRVELVNVYVTQLRNGDLFYVDTVVPENESSRYNSAFRNLINSIRISDQ